MYFCFIIYILTASSVAVSEKQVKKSDLIYVDQTVDSSILFPEKLDVKFKYNGLNVEIVLRRDDTSTSQLSDFIFDTSRVLPDGLFRQEKSHEFSVYSSDNANFVMHRIAVTVPGKLFGQVILDNMTFTMTSENNNPFQYRLTEQTLKSVHQGTDTRHKRDKVVELRQELTDYSNVVELFVLTDYSIYDFWSSSVKSDAVPGDIKTELRIWLKALFRDVDTLFKRIKEYSSVDVRVYVQGMYISTDPKEVLWVDRPILGNTIDVKRSLNAAKEYYQNLVDKFAFPNADHVIVLTKYDLDSGEQFSTGSQVCDTNNQRAVSYVNTMYSVKAIAQAIATSMGVRLDGAYDSPCETSDRYVMSTDYVNPVSETQYGNPWKFSVCSILNLQDFIESGKSTCLFNTDTDVDFKRLAYIQSIGSRYSPSEQCRISFGQSSSFCTMRDGPELSECFNLREGCIVDGICVPHHMGDLTTCGEDSGCRYGACRSKRGVEANVLERTSSFFFSSSSVGTSFIPTSATTSTTEKNLQSSSTTTVTTTTTEPTTTTTTATTTTTEPTTTTTTATTTTTEPTTTTTTATTTTTEPTTTTTTATTTTTEPTTTTTTATTTTTEPTTTTTTATTTTTEPTTTTTTATTTTTEPTTTTERNLQSSSTTTATTTTATPSCVIDYGFTEIPLPGCGCCGGCGCDASCDNCPNGLGRPAFALNSEQCNITDNCCQDKIRISTFFVPADCDFEVSADNQTIVVEKTGWEVTDLEVNAVAKRLSGGGWSVVLES